MRLGSLLEDNGNYYAAEYYSNKSGHGEVGWGKDFEAIMKKANQLQKDQDEDIEYIGVVGDGMEFAILKITDNYLKKVLNPMDFKSKQDYKNFMKVGLRVLKTGKPQKGRFDS